MGEQTEEQLHFQPWRDRKNGRLERTIKELSQFDNKRTKELESEFDHFDAAYSYPTPLFKDCNIVDLDFVYKQLLDGHKPCNTTLSLTQYQRERLIGLTSILYLSMLNYSTVTMIKSSIYEVMLSVQQIPIRSSCCESTFESG